jgi:YD repeat-containing protein
VKNQVSASSGDDITTTYTLDDNGRPTTIADPRGNSWTKAYDAMGRMTTLTTPNPGGRRLGIR